MKRRIALWLQYVLPHRLCSRMVHRFMRIRAPWLKNRVIKHMVRAFDINLDEAASASFDDYAHFNAFFTRALKPGSRPMDTDSDALVSPVDGVVSQAGDIREGRIIQAKGQSYTVQELLADDTQAYQNGRFITLYLSPRDYHRIHAPADCTLHGLRHVPGRLFSVAEWTAQAIPRLFARNERLVNRIEIKQREVAFVYVGAILVSSIETVSHGVITPPYAKTVHDIAVEKPLTYRKGEEMGRFNMGSTVILVFPEGAIEFEPSIVPGAAVRLGQKIATIN